MPCAGGGGPKERLLAATVAEHGLEERVTLAGPVPQEHVPEFLVSCSDHCPVSSRTPHAVAAGSLCALPACKLLAGTTSHICLLLLFRC